MNETKKEGQSKLTISLIVGLAMLIIGIAMVVVGIVVNAELKKALTDSVKQALAENPNAFPNGRPKYAPGWYIYLLEIGGAIVFFGSFSNLYYYFQNKFNIKKMNVKQMCVIAVFGALSVILYYFAKFKVPFFPSWLDIQFSEVPALFASFMYGPVTGAIIIVIRFFCKLPGTSTVGVGELADLLIGLTLVFVSGIIYKKHKNIKGALAGLGIGMASATAVAVVANWLILIPAYLKLANYKMSDLVFVMDSVMGAKGIVTEANFMPIYLFVGVLPFNLFRYVLVFVITVLLYKRLHILINMITGEDSDEKVEVVEEQATVLE